MAGDRSDKIKEGVKCKTSYLNFPYTPINLTSENLTNILNSMIKQIPQTIDIQPIYHMSSFLNSLSNNMSLTSEQIDLIITIIQQIFQVYSKIDKIKFKKFDYESLFSYFNTSISANRWMCPCCLSSNYSSDKCYFCEYDNKKPDPSNYTNRLIKISFFNKIIIPLLNTQVIHIVFFV